MSDTTSTTPDTSTDVRAYGMHLAAITATDDEAYGYAVATYASASSGDKARMRAMRNDAAKSAMRTLDPKAPTGLVVVQALMTLEDAQSNAVGTKSATPVDPRVGVAVTISALLARAANAAVEIEGTLEDYAFVADLVALATGADLSTLVDALSDGPGIVGDVSTYAAKIKLPTGRGDIAEGGDVAAHIYQALVILDRPAKISEIVKVSTEAYPNGASGSGAISARLFPTKGDCTVTGVVPTYVDGVKAAKLA